MIKTLKILIADDDELFLCIAKKLIQEDGYEVITAKSGEEAMKLALLALPQLIILDSNMPSLSGEEVCNRLKQDESFKTVPIIIISGLEDERSITRFLNSGCDDYYPKSKLIENLSVKLRERISKALKSL